MIVKFEKWQEKRRQSACDEWQGLLHIDTTFKHSLTEIDSITTAEGQFVVVSAADIEAGFTAFEEYITDRRQAEKKYSCRDFTNRRLF